MIVPEAFTVFTRLLHQDILVLCPSWMEAVRRTRDFLTREQLDSVRAFLDLLASGQYNNDQLQELWISSESDFYVEGGDLAGFFKMMRSCLD